MLSPCGPNEGAADLIARGRIFREGHKERTCTPRLHRQWLAKTGLREHRNTETVESLSGARPLRTADRTDEQALGHSLAMRKKNLRAASFDVRFVSVRSRKVWKFSIRSGARAAYERSSVAATIGIAIGLLPHGRAFWATELPSRAIKAAPLDDPVLAAIGQDRALVTHRSSLSSEEPAQKSLLRVQAVLRLIEHRALRTVDHLVGDLLAAMRRKVVQDDRVRFRPREKRRVELEPLERATATLVLLFLTHAGPHIRVHDVRAAHRGDRIVAERDLRPARPRLGRREPLVSLKRLVSGWRRDAERRAGLGGAQHQRVRDVVAVGDVRDLDPAKIGPFSFTDREDVGQALARMGQVGEPVDHRDVAVAREFLDGLVGVHAQHHRVGHAARDAGDVRDAFAAAEADLLWREVHAVAAELSDAHIEREPGTEARLLEN